MAAFLCGWCVAGAQNIAVKDSYVVARQLYNSGQRVAGEWELSKVAPHRVSPSDWGEYHFRRGYAAFMSGNYTLARTEFVNARQSFTYRPHADYYIAYADYAMGDWASAARGFKKLENSNTYRNLVPYYLMQIEFAQGDYDGAANRAEMLLATTTGERRTEIARMAAEARFRLGDHALALDNLERYRAEGGMPSRVENYMSGFSLYSEGEYERAADYLSRVVSIDDSLSQNASYHLADAYLKLGDKTKAAQSFSIAATSGHDGEITRDALLNYGKILYETGGGRFNEAVKVMERFVNDYPESEQVTEVRGMLQKLNYAYALELWTEAMGIPSPGDLPRQAIDLLNKSLEYPADKRYAALAKFWKGEIYYAEGRVDSAAVLYRAYIDTSPVSERENGIARYNLGYIDFNEQRWGPAQTYFNGFLNQWPARDAFRADALNRLGDTRHAQREYWRAIESYDGVLQMIRQGGIRTAPDVAAEGYYAAYQRAMMLGLVDRVDRKVESLRDIIDSSRGDWVDEATYQLGRTYIGEEQFAEGAKILAGFIGKYPTSPLHVQALIDLGLAHSNMGQGAEAKKYYEMAVQEAPVFSRESEEAMAGLRGIYVAEGNVDGYVTWTERAQGARQVTASQRDSLLFMAAERVYLSGDDAKAQEALRDYIDTAPTGEYVGTANGYLAAMERARQMARAEAAVADIERLYREGKYGEGEAAVFALSDSKTPNTYMLGKAFLVLGDIYVARGDTFQARATFQSIVDGYVPDNDGIVAAAADKIANLK